MGRNNRNRLRRELINAARRLTPSEKAQLANCAKNSGALVPLSWAIVLIFAIVCLVAALVINFEAPPSVAPMFLLGGSLLPVVTIAAREWVYKAYYRKPVVIGA